MMRHWQLGWDDCVAIWRRRRRLISIPLVVGPALLYALSLILPASYDSDTRNETLPGFQVGVTLSSARVAQQACASEPGKIERAETPAA